MGVALSVQHRDGKEVTALRIRRIDRHSIDLGRGIGRSYVSVGRVPRSAATDHEHVTPPRRPFALHSPQPLARVDHEVVTSPLNKRPRHLEAEPNGFCHDLCLRDRPLLVRRELHPAPNTSSYPGRNLPGIRVMKAMTAV